MPKKDLTFIERTLNEVKFTMCDAIDSYISEMKVREKLPEAGKYKSCVGIPDDEISINIENEVDCGFLGDNKTNDHYVKVSMVISKKYKN